MTQLIAKSAHYWWAYDDALFRAVGRVAAANALFDELLTELVDELLSTELAGRLFVGQTSDSLSQSARILFEDLTLTEPRDPPGTRERFFALLEAADRLRHH
jgi:hypothetical protein